MQLLLDTSILILFGCYSVSLVYLGWKEGRKSKWQETKDFSPIPESEKPTAESTMGREKPQELTDG
jgi:hypothetical protein